MPTPFLFTQKEMAARIGRSREYVRQMCRQGFVLPATVEEAVVFLRQHPAPCKNRHGERRKRQP